MKTFIATWRIPLLLILLSLVPVIAGSVRLNELASNPEITAENARFVQSPLPVALHIISVTLFSLLGAFQFSPRFRKSNPGWHRRVGRVLLPAGLIAALSGLWMTLFYDLPLYDGTVLYGLRLLFGSLMLLALGLATVSIYQRKYKIHGIWMIRAYAIAMGAGTQVFTHIPWALFPHLQGEVMRTICMATGWLINIAVAEWIIQNHVSKRTVSVPLTKPLITALSQKAE